LKTLGHILGNAAVGETMVVPWCLLFVRLILPEPSTFGGAQLPEIGFWVLLLSENPILVADPPNELTITFAHPRRCCDAKDSLYTRAQLHHAVDLFISLIVFIYRSHGPFGLNQFRSNPLQHVFGHAHIRCQDVNTTKSRIAALSGPSAGARLAGFFSITFVSNRRRSVGVNCVSISEDSTPFTNVHFLLIARSVLVRSSNPSSIDEPFAVSPVVPIGWNELLKIPENPAMDGVPLEDIPTLPTVEPAQRPARGCRRIKSSSILSGHHGDFISSKFLTHRGKHWERVRRHMKHATHGFSFWIQLSI
jgi:hypothetical protein